MVAWMTASLELTPNSERVVVRYVRLETVDAARAKRQLALLSDAERRVHERRVGSAQLAYATGHALLRETLSACAGGDPGYWRFVPGSMGKPEIATRRPEEKWEFNLSHTLGLVACVVARSSRVGIDVENAKRRRAYSALARRVLAPAELEDVETRAPSDRSARFLEYWTLKEARLKARGTGIRAPLREMQFRLLPGEGAECAADSEAREDGGGWHYLRLHPAPGYFLAAACWSARPPQWEIQEVGS